MFISFLIQRLQIPPGLYLESYHRYSLTLSTLGDSFSLIVFLD